VRIWRRRPVAGRSRSARCCSTARAPTEGELVIDDSYGFVVDPAVAKALRDDVRALEDLPKTWPRNRQGRLKDQHDVRPMFHRKLGRSQCRGPITSTNGDQTRWPDQALPERPNKPRDKAKVEVVVDAAKDEERLDELPTKRKSGVKSTREEEAEEAHLMARSRYTK
jgi:hypothetical protein